MSRSFNVLAIDPGGTTGLVHAFYNDYGPQPAIAPALDDFNITTHYLGPREHHSELYNYIIQQNHRHLSGEILAPMEIVSEQFDFRQSNQRDKLILISREYIGIAKLIASQLALTYYEQSASMAKSFVSDDKLDRLGLLLKPASTKPNKDMNDALRHLIRFLVVTKRVRRPIVDKWGLDK